MLAEYHKQKQNRKQKKIVSLHEKVFSFSKIGLVDSLTASYLSLGSTRKSVSLMTRNLLQDTFIPTFGFILHTLILTIAH
jgi:hypothetical protein